MFQHARIAVVVPAHNEAERIGTVIARMPAFVDRIVVVDDASCDGTCARVEQAASPRVRLVRHAANRGVGAAIMTGYRIARDEHADVIAVMAGDDQMDPADLEAVVRPVVEGRADYVKGNRLEHPGAQRMPWARRLGTRVLASLTRAATGLVSLSDSQCGFTAISGSAVDRLPLARVWPRFGYPNDLLARIHEHGLRLQEVVVRPVYQGERSELRAWHLFAIAGVLRRARRRRRARG
jgi:glycosyltransferase involved in cell wall biosynthesis